MQQEDGEEGCTPGEEGCAPRRRAHRNIVSGDLEWRAAHALQPCSPVHSAALCAPAAAPSIHVITCYQPATRYVEHADGFWRSEKDVAEDGQAVGLQQPVGLQQRASPTAEAPEAGTPEAATGDRGAAAAAGVAGAGAAAATMIEEVRAPPCTLRMPYLCLHTYYTRRGGRLPRVRTMAILTMTRWSSTGSTCGVTSGACCGAAKKVTPPTMRRSLGNGGRCSTPQGCAKLPRSCESGPRARTGRRARSEDLRGREIELKTNICICGLHGGLQTTKAAECSDDMRG